MGDSRVVSTGWEGVLSLSLVFVFLSVRERSENADGHGRLCNDAAADKRHRICVG